MMGIMFRMLGGAGIYLAFFVVIRLWGLNGLLPSSVLPPYASQWLGSRLVLDLLEAMPVALLAGVTLAWSSFIDKALVRRVASRGGFARLLQPAISLIMILAFLTAATVILVEGPARHRQDEAVSQSLLARQYHEVAQKLRFEGSLVAANLENRKALALVPEWEDALRFRDEVVEAIAESYKDPPPVVETPVRMAQGMTWDDLQADITGAMASGDLYSALYWSEEALRLGTDDQDLATGALIEEIRQRIGSVPAPDAPTDPVAWEIKREAIFVDYREGRFLDAYYKLRQVQALDPEDKDMRIWLPQILEALAQVHFFVDEYEEAMAHAASNPVMARVPTDRGTRWFYAGRMLKGRHTWFFLDAELVAFDPDGRLTLHYRIPVAKVLENSGAAGAMLLLGKSSLRNQEGITGMVEVLKGPEPGEGTGLVMVELKADDLWTLAQGGADVESMGLGDLWFVHGVARQNGWDVRPLQKALLHRFGMVLIFPALWFLAIALAWSNRSRHHLLPLPLIILAIPALGVGWHYLWQAIDCLVALSTTLLLARFNLWTSMAILGGVASLGLVWSMFSAGLQKAD